MGKFLVGSSLAISISSYVAHSLRSFPSVYLSIGFFPFQFIHVSVSLLLFFIRVFMINKILVIKCSQDGHDSNDRNQWPKLKDAIFD